MIVLVNGRFLTNLEGEEVDVLHAEELGLTDHPIVGRKAIEECLDGRKCLKSAYFA